MDFVEGPRGGLASHRRAPGRKIDIARTAGIEGAGTANWPTGSSEESCLKF